MNSDDFCAKLQTSFKPTCLWSLKASLTVHNKHGRRRINLFPLKFTSATHPRVFMQPSHPDAQHVRHFDLVQHKTRTGPDRNSSFLGESRVCDPPTINPWPPSLLGFCCFVNYVALCSCLHHLRLTQNTVYVWMRRRGTWQTADSWSTFEYAFYIQE